MKSKKKKVLGELISNFETFTRYSWVKDKKKVVGVLNSNFLSSPVGGGNNLFNFLNRGYLKKKVWETLV